MNSRTPRILCLYSGLAETGETEPQLLPSLEGEVVLVLSGGTGADAAGYIGTINSRSTANGSPVAVTSFSMADASDPLNTILHLQASEVAGKYLSVDLTVDANANALLDARIAYWPKYDTSAVQTSADGVAVNPPTAIVVPYAANLPSGTESVAYSQQLYAAGGTAPYTWALADGSDPLPTGITLSAGGLLSGTPSAAASYTFTVAATDANDVAGEQDFTIVIGA